MKAYNINKYSCSILLLVMLLIFSCTSKTVCPEDVKTIKGKIISLSGYQNMRIGEQAAITIGVRNESLLCVKEARASFTNTGLDTLLVHAELSYIDGVTLNDCDCKRDSVIYTLLYFTPLNEGTYNFITEPDSSATNTQPSANDGLNFTISVE